MNTRTILFRAICAAFITAGIFVLAACAPPVGTEGGGNLRVLLSGGNRTIAADTLVYRLEFRSAGGETLTRSAGPGAVAVTVTVSLGRWTIHADAYTADGVYYGSGDTSLVVGSGKTNNVTVPMTFFPTWYVAQGGVDSIDRGSEAAPFETLSYALSVISDTYNGGAGWSKNGGSVPAPARILIKGTVTGSASSSTMIEITDGALYDTLPPIILAGYGGGGTLDATGLSRRVLYINKADVTLGANLTLTGGDIYGQAGGGVLFQDGLLTLEGGIITGNETSDSAGATGGGVRVSGGSFTMKGGSIDDNYANASSGSSNGGGVSVGPGASFTMTGGTIGANYSVSASGGNAYGGGVFVDAAAFTMDGGTVVGNTARAGDASGIGAGGGVYVSGGTFTLNGGAVSGNGVENTAASANASGAGVYVRGVTGYPTAFVMNGGTIGGNDDTEANMAPSGGGVAVNRNLLEAGVTFDMNGGLIRKNGTQGGSGGGVHITGADTVSFTMWPGARITRNVGAVSGGGVYVNGSNHTFTMHGGSIDDNAAHGSGGGGVYFGGSGTGTFAMDGGTISGNTAAGDGGGVYVYYPFDFNKSGGTIYGSNEADSQLKNTATSNNGHAVYLASGPYKRDSTAGPGVTLNSDGTGDWE
jgi:hypothetical protein